MKRLMIIAAWLCSMAAVAQTANVGVNTRTPESTLDVRATKAADSETTNEGILAPRLTKTRVANIATPVEGTLVYVTDVTYTGSNVKVAKVTEKGYYFYNGTEWVKVITFDDPSKWQNDAVNTLVKLKNLSDGVTSRTNDKNVFVADDGKMGVGAVSPARKLHVIGDNTTDPVLRIQNTPTKDLTAQELKDYSPLFLNKATGDVVGHTTLLPKSWYVTYKCINTWGDHIEELNTNIDVTKYTIQILGREFYTPEGNTAVINTSPYPGGYSSAALKIYPFIKNGKWCIMADYPEVGLIDTATGDFILNGICIFHVLITANVVVNVGEIQVDMMGQIRQSVSTTQVASILGQ